ncbi:MAG: hypothetical protein K9M82_00505 [Deltaproteobacteria bacterium]|nr:hypothetical protein [Deltaproteobacteria bacterium]
METEILTLLEQRGPLTGSELLECLSTDSLTLWRHCTGSTALIVRSIAHLYLRLDRRIDNYARLSPSILREFLTYSVVARRGAEEELESRLIELSRRIESVTRDKSQLAYRTISALVSRADNPDLIREQSCFILAGDIVYGMAHDVPRPERSTGRLVQGSDLDLVIIVSDGFPEDHRRRLDERIFREKHRMLTTPQLREEIDYVIKGLDTVREQLRFDTFRHMVACKIMQEGTFLYGNETLFTAVKRMLAESGAAARLNEMEKEAGRFRSKAEEILLEEEMETIRRDHLDLFYPTEESEEFE